MEGRETLVRNLKVRTLRRPGHRWEDDVKVDLKEVWSEDLD
jgi:hypothetical protein